MITGITGLPGSGKTLYSVQRMLAEIAADRAIHANFHSRTGKWSFSLWEQMMEAENATCVIDEAQMWFGSRAWRDQSQTDLAIFQQSRKEGIDLWWIAQHEARVDVAIREVTAFYRRCRMFSRLGLCMVTTVAPDEPKKPLKREWVRLRSDLFRHYWTEERIGGRDGQGYGFGRGRVSEGARPWQTGSSVVVAPNLWRVDLPYGQTQYLTEYREVPRALESALRSWETSGRRPYAETLVKPLYRDELGKVHVLALGAILEPCADPMAASSWLAAAIQDVVQAAEKQARRLGVYTDGPEVISLPPDVSKRAEGSGLPSPQPLPKAGSQSEGLAGQIPRRTLIRRVAGESGRM